MYVKMSIQTLPPVWKKWTDEDLSTLTKSEVWALHAIIENKMFQLEDNFDKRVFFKDPKYAKIFNNHHGETKKKKKSQIAEGQRIHYNFVKPHQALQGQTPAQNTGLNIKGWKELLRKSTVG